MYRVLKYQCFSLSVGTRSKPSSTNKFDYLLHTTLNPFNGQIPLTVNINDILKYGDGIHKYGDGVHKYGDGVHRYGDGVHKYGDR